MGKKCFMSIKLNMSKAYDRMEWSFVEKVMLRLGFWRRWVSLIMDCISSVSYSILFNGVPKGPIIPSGGLRQGHPLSPYLFFLRVEWLTSLLRWVEQVRKITVLSICRGAPRISHLFFVDDSLLFYCANIEENMHVQHLLKLYEEASGQKINKEKTSLFFSKNINQGDQDRIKSICVWSIWNNMRDTWGYPPFLSDQRSGPSRR